MPYEDARRVECVVGSTPWSVDTKLPSEAYWPAEAPTCHDASTTLAPARTPRASAPAGASSSAAASTAMQIPPRDTRADDATRVGPRTPYASRVAEHEE